MVIDSLSRHDRYLFRIERLLASQNRRLLSFRKDGSPAANAKYLGERLHLSSRIQCSYQITKPLDLYL